MASFPRINPLLLQYAVKQAFVPSDAAAGAGGPPAGGPPPDASAGGPPPSPPAGGGGPPPSPPAGGGSGGDLMSALPQMIQTAVQSAMGGMGGQPGQPGAMGPNGQPMGKPGKPDPMAQAMDLFQIKKMLTHICRINGWELPPDILDGPNRDPQTGAPMPPGAPGSTSDPAMSQGAPAQGGGSPGAIPPIEPIQGASPMGGGHPHHMHHHHKASSVKFAHEEKVELLKCASDVFRLYALVLDKTSDAWAEYTGKTAAEGDAAIYGSSNGPGQPCRLKQAADMVHTRAQAVAKMFSLRRN